MQVTGGDNSSGGQDFFAGIIQNTGGSGAGLLVRAGWANPQSVIPVLRTEINTASGIQSPFTVTQGLGVFARTLTVTSGMPGESGFVAPSAYFNVFGSRNNAYLAWMRNSGGDGGALLLSGTSGDPNGTQPILRVETYDGRLRLEVTEGGVVRVPTLQILGGSDIAEPVAITPTAAISKAEPGMVMVIDRDHDGKLVPCSAAYDRAVAGVLSGANGLKPGMVLSAEGQPHTAAGNDTMPLAMTGRVWVMCDASHGAIHRGDSLTTSMTPGHAMVATDDARASRAVIGKAMTELVEGRGMVLVLVNLQ